jgi:3-hydroxyacyl-[acyl-carrier-protein] dehydratase
MTEAVQLDMQAILERLPHRYPFLLVDRVLECRPGESIRALKNVTYNEPFFPGHFPGRPVMPGVMIIEALAQAAGILCFVTANVIPDHTTRFYFVGIDKARFRRPVVPGDQLRIEVDVLAWRLTAARLEGKAYVGDKVAAEAVVTCRLVPRAMGAAGAEPREET